MTETLTKARPWGLDSPWNVDLAWAVVGLYLAVNAAFLRSYPPTRRAISGIHPLTRRFGGRSGPSRQDAPERLHASGQSTVSPPAAHSFGSVAAYDMSRADCSRVCNEFPPVAELGPDFDDIDGAPWQPEDQAGVG